MSQKFVIWEESGFMRTGKLTDRHTKKLIAASFFRDSANCT